MTEETGTEYTYLTCHTVLIGATRAPRPAMLATHHNLNIVIDIEVLCLDAWILFIDVGCTVLHPDSTILKTSLDPSTVISVEGGDIIAQVVCRDDQRWSW